MKLAGIDFTGIAYMTAIGLSGLIVYGIYKKTQAAGSTIADSAADLLNGAKSAAAAVGTALNPADPGNIVNTGLSAALSSAAGRETSLGSLIADAFPSPAEVAANASLTPSQGWTSGFDLPFSPPPFVGSIPDDPSQPAIFYRVH